MMKPIPPASQDPTNPPAPAEPVATGNRAAAQCVQVYQQTYEDARLEGANTIQAQDTAARKYRAAMPAPSGREGIRDFIACIAYGVLIGAVSTRESTALLYAAQIAQGALREPRVPAPKRR